MCYMITAHSSLSIRAGPMTDAFIQIDPHHPHDHSQCVSEALDAAEQLCAQAGVRFTVLRKRVLELVWQSHKPLGAYDILETLAREDDRRAAPPTVYRALDFLQQHGLVHRIASLNAFIGCSHAQEHHTGLFLICQGCRIVHELASEPVSQAIEQAARGEGFTAVDTMIEVSGLCPRCQPHQATPV